jgi:anti-sigma regulatory factor (Ser/Thr protein kinase)
VKCCAYLAGNAVKFTEKGHIYLSASCKEQSREQACFQISVEDTGIGVPQDKIGLKGITGLTIVSKQFFASDGSRLCV